MGTPQAMPDPLDFVLCDASACTFSRGGDSMRARNVPLGSMFGWIPATFRMVFGHFGAMALAALITLLVAMLCTAPIIYYDIKQMMPQLGSPGVPQPIELTTTFWIIYAACVLLATVVMTPMMAGWMRLCHAADRGQVVSPMQIFAPFRDTGTWGRLMLFVVMIVGLFVVFGLVFWLLFSGAINGVMAMQAAQKAAMATGSPVPPPDMAVLGSIMLMYVVGIPVFALLLLVYFVGIAEIALGQASPVAALTEAAGGVLRNLIKLLVFGFCLTVGIVILFFIVALVLGIAGAVVMMMSPVLGMIALFVVYLVMIVVVYPLMFSSNYLVWKDMLGDTSPPALTL
jgi:hypothetical protein